MISDYFSLALGSLRKRFLRTLLTMIGIFIGIAAVVSLISLGQGMQSAINAQFASVGTDKVLIQGASAGFGPPGQNTAGSVTEDDLNLVEDVSGVKLAAGRLFQSVNAEYSGQTKIVFGVSLPERDDRRELIAESMNLEIAEGREPKSGDSGKILVGNAYADEFFTKEVRIGSKIMINDKKFEVVGIAEKSGRFDDMIFMNEEDLREILGEEDKFNIIVAQTDPGADTDDVSEKISKKMRRDRNQKEGFEDFTVETSQELIDSVNLILGVLQAIFIGIAAISLLVGGIGIMNTMYTAVLERTREIGIMKAVGARNGDILMLFLVESGILGLTGGGIGVLIGMGLSKLVELASRQAIGGLIQAHFPITLIIGALAFSFLVGTISGLFPAIQASKLQPVEAFRE